jgi:hypothetical protein
MYFDMKSYLKSTRNHIAKHDPILSINNGETLFYDSIKNNII